MEIVFSLDSRRASDEDLECVERRVNSATACMRYLLARLIRGPFSFNRVEIVGGARELRWTLADGAPRVEVPIDLAALLAQHTDDIKRGAIEAVRLAASVFPAERGSDSRAILDACASAEGMNYDNKWQGPKLVSPSGSSAFVEYEYRVNDLKVYVATKSIDEPEERLRPVAHLAAGTDPTLAENLGSLAWEKDDVVVLAGDSRRWAFKV